MSLLAEIQSKCSPELLASRDTAAIAAAVNVGRVRVESRMLSERGVLSALGPTAGDEFLTALEAAATSPDALPVPLRQFYGAIRRAVGWLKGDGIDVGDPVARSLLDGMAAGGVIEPASAAAIKKLAERPDTVTPEQILEALGGSTIYSHDGLAVGDWVRALAPFDASFPGLRRVLAITQQGGDVLYRITGGWELRREHLEAV